MQFNEELLAGDLKRLIDNIFEVDSYKSKMGEDQDIVVLSFTSKYEDPAKDLVKFIERGYDFVLDADVTPGELNDGNYKVFVEIERNRRIASQILEILNGIEKLTGIENFKFRYYKSFNSMPADLETLEKNIPSSKDEYNNSLKENAMNNFSNFFNRSYLENIHLENDDIIFQKKYAGPLRMRIQNFGKTPAVYDTAPGRIMIESIAVSEIMFLTKYLGNYNITKIGDSFIFENNGHAVSLTHLK